MAFKTRAEILASTKRRYTEVDGVRIQSLTEIELSTLRGIWASRYDKDKPLDLTSRRELFVMTVVDENGNREFTNEDVELLGEVDGSVVERVYEAAAKHVGLRDEDEVAKLEKK